MAYKNKVAPNINVPYKPAPAEPVEVAETQPAPNPVVEQPVEQPQPTPQPVEQPQLPVEQPQLPVEQPQQPEEQPKKYAAPVFKVQILASSKKLKQGDAQLKGEKNAAFYKEGGMYKYTVGASTNYQEIYNLRKQLVARFPQAFIIAFKNDVKVDVNEAIREYRSKKVKK